MSFECEDVDSSLYQNEDGLLDVHFESGSGFEIIEGYGGGLALTDTERSPLWYGWSPQWTNLTVNSGRQTAKYMKVNKLIFYTVVLYLASDSAVGTSPYFAPPVPFAASFIGQGTSGYYSPVGQCWMADIGTTNYVGTTYEYNGNFYPGVFTTNTTEVYLNGVTASVPFTWTTGDMISLNGWYKAA